MPHCHQAPANARFPAARLHPKGGLYVRSVSSSSGAKRARRRLVDAATAHQDRRIRRRRPRRRRERPAPARRAGSGQGPSTGAAVANQDPRRSTPELRTEIARLDREILARLEARARASKEIRARAESEPAPDVTDRDALTALSAAATGDLPSDALYTIYSAIRASARALEQAPRVAYLGPEGGFSHVLGRTHFGAGGAFIECPSVREALEEVARGRAAYAIFPFESSADGLVQASVTALTDTELVIVGARTLPVTFQLMSRARALSDLEKVYTTPAGHAACQRFLDAELPRVSVIDVRSMKVAAELSHEDASSAALLPEPTGSEQGLPVLRENVADVAEIKMRFAIAASRRRAVPGPTSRACSSARRQAGSLFDICDTSPNAASTCGVSTRAPRSRAVGLRFLRRDRRRHATERSVITALEAVKKSTRYLRVLGSFPQSLTQGRA